MKLVSGEPMRSRVVPTVELFWVHVHCARCRLGESGAGTWLASSRQVTPCCTTMSRTFCFIRRNVHCSVGTSILTCCERWRELSFRGDVQCELPRAKCTASRTGQAVLLKASTWLSFGPCEGWSATPANAWKNLTASQRREVLKEKCKQPRHRGQRSGCADGRSPPPSYHVQDVGNTPAARCARR